MKCLCRGKTKEQTLSLTIKTNPEMPTITVTPHLQGAGYKNEQVPIESNLKKSKFTAEINTFTACYKKLF